MVDARVVGAGERHDVVAREPARRGRGRGVDRRSHVGAAGGRPVRIDAVGRRGRREHAAARAVQQLLRGANADAAAGMASTATKSAIRQSATRRRS